MRSITLVCVLALFVGCQKRDTRDRGVQFQGDKSKYTLLIVADIEIVKNNPHAYDFVVRVLDRYNKDRMCEPDAVIISQLSGNDHPVLFEGSTQTLRREMPNSEAFREYLVSRSNPGRRLHQGLSESFEYLLDTYSVARGGSCPVALVISSLGEGEPEDSESEDRFIESLIKFHKRGAEMAFYFIDQRRTAWLKERTKKAGIEWVHLERDPNGQPYVPSFE